MKFKYLQITDKSVLNEIEACIVSIETRDKSLRDLAKKFGAYNCLQFSDGRVAGFEFSSRPEKTTWKNVKYGFMPKAKTSELKMMNDIPCQKDYRDTIKQYGFGGEMIIGQPNGVGGFPMHSSSIKGNRKTSFYVIKVPFQGDFDKEVDQSLVEIKEWEMLKGIDDGSDK